jgi:hypothetical protein
MVLEAEVNHAASKLWSVRVSLNQFNAGNWPAPALKARIKKRRRSITSAA